MRTPFQLAAALGMLSLAISTQAQAHAHLEAAEPAANSTGAAPRQLMLHFSEKLIPKFSTIEVAKANGGKVAVKSGLAKDGMAIIAKPAKMLAAGGYKVTWHAVTADGHRMDGTYTLTVQ